MTDAVAIAALWVEKASRVILFTGAGVSTESGIPDFRSPGGIWERYDPREFTYQRFLTSEEARKTYWKMHTEFYRLLLSVRPNPSHYACVELDRMGKLDCVITQNVDNLHQTAGLAPGKVIELHGNALAVACLQCGELYSRADVQGWIEAGQEVPRCGRCNGLLKPRTISFGQAMPVQEMQEAIARSRRCDLFVVAGSSLVVEPAASIPLLARDAGARLIIVNLTATAHDSSADLVLHGGTGQTLQEIVRRTTRESHPCQEEGDSAT